MAAINPQPAPALSLRSSKVRFTVGMSLFSAFTDGRSGNLAVPENLSEILYTLNPRTCKMHLYERFLSPALTAAVTIDNDCLKKDSLEPWNMPGDITRGSCQAVVIVPTVVAPANLTALIPGSMEPFPNAEHLEIQALPAALWPQ